MKPVLKPVAKPKTQVQFTPHKGLMSLAESLARVVERKTGFAFWDGEDGLGAVCDQKLCEIGVPRGPLMIAGSASITPRGLAQEVGFIKRPRRVKAKAK